MWAGKALKIAMGVLQSDLAERIREIASLRGENTRLKIETERQQGLIEWMKLRLNAVEKERAQLIAAAIGVKISIPEFVPAQKDSLEDTLHEMPNLSTVGGDAAEEPEGRARTELDPGVDYSQMPGYRANR
jgi:hypothetical protein